MKHTFQKYIGYLPNPKSESILNHYWNFLQIHSNDIFTENDYTEIHHCVPRAYLKNQEEANDKENLIELRGRDHYTAHLLLWLALRDKSSTIAFSFMNDFKREPDWKINAKLYEELRFEFSKYMSSIHKGKESHNKNRTYITNPITNQHKLVKTDDLEKYLIAGWIIKGPSVPEHQKKWLSEHYKGKNNPVHKHPYKDETRNKMRKAMSNLIWVNDGTINKRIKSEEFSKYLDDGFVEGRINFKVKNSYDFSGKNNGAFGSKWVTDGKVNKFIKKDELEHFLESNPKFYIGMTDNRNHKNTKRTYKTNAHWYNDGKKNYFLSDLEYDDFSDKTYLSSGRYQFDKKIKGSKKF